jgi:hypothetical protein
MGKSEIKNLLRQKWTPGFSSYVPSGVEMVITDVMSFLYRFPFSMPVYSKCEKTGKSIINGTRATGLHLFNAFLYMVMGPFSDPSTREHVVVFDKSICTLPTKISNTIKKQESDTSRLLEFAKNCEKDDGKDFIQLNEILPQPWDAVMQDRARMRRWVIQFCTRNLVEAVAARHHLLTCLPERATIVFDGGFCEAVTLQDKDIYSPHAPFRTVMGRKRIDSPWKPLVWDKIGTEDAKHVERGAPREEKSKVNESFYVQKMEGRILLGSHDKANNLVGEADWALYTHVNRGILEGVRKFLLSSIDIDVLLLGIFFKQRINDRSLVLLVRNEFPSFDKTEILRYPIKSIERFPEKKISPGRSDTRMFHVMGPWAWDDRGYVQTMDTEIILQGILTDFAALGDPLELCLSVLGSIVMGESDYTSGVPGVASFAFFETYAKVHDLIGPLFRKDACILWDSHPMLFPVLSGEAFGKLVTATLLEYANRSIPCHMDISSGVSYDELREIVKKSKHGIKNRHLVCPDMEYLNDFAMHLQYYTLLLWQVGRGFLSVPNDDSVVHFGYSTLDPGNSFCRGNLTRTANLSKSF